MGLGDGASISFQAHNETMVAARSDDAWMYSASGRKVSTSVKGFSKDGRLRLFGINEIWRHLAFNKHILHSYRMALTPEQCLRSMFQIHNETGNIWSHFSVIFFFLYRTCSGGPWPGAPFFYCCAVIPCSLCLLCSSVYHTFMPLPYGQDVYNLLLRIDYLSVFNTMLWPQIYAIHWSLICRPALLQQAFVCYYSVSCVCVMLVLRAATNSQRLFPFAILSAMRLAFLSLRIRLGAGSAEGTQLYVGVEVTGILGGLLNVARFPECLAPGRFDILFNSHQLMHVLTAMCQLCCFFAGEADYKHWAAHTCP